MGHRTARPLAKAKGIPPGKVGGGIEQNNGDLPWGKDDCYILVSYITMNYIM